MDKEAKPFRFLDLPRELRDHVYDYAVPSSTWIAGDAIGCGRFKTRSIAGGLLRASRQTYDELMTACIRYTRATIEGPADSKISLARCVSVLRFMRFLDPQNRKIIPTIQAEIADENEMRRYLQSCLPGLLRLNCQAEISLKLVPIRPTSYLWPLLRCKLMLRQYLYRLEFRRVGRAKHKANLLKLSQR